MHMTETVSSRLMDALRAAGIPAYPEYPQVLKPMPHVPFLSRLPARRRFAGSR